MNLKKLFFASALLFAACGTIQAQEVIAHRGFWTTDGSAQNSLAALVKADSIHCYGSEFDVGSPQTISWLSIMTPPLKA